jgi:glycosyltransferase involved in cell wall biosynthesis
LNSDGQYGKRKLITFFLPNLEGGGAERSICHLANEISYLGIDVDLVLGHAKGAYIKEVSQSVNIVDLKCNRISKSFLPLINYLVNNKPTIFISALDHLNIISSFIFLILYKCRVKHVMMQRSIISETRFSNSSFKNALLKIIFKFTYNRADFIIANSRSAIDDINLNLGINYKKMAYIHNAVNIDGIDANMYKPLVKEWNFLSKAGYILAVGSFTKLKDFETLIRAYYLLKLKTKIKLHLVLLGEGPYLFELLALVKKLNLTDHVHFPGFDSNPYRWMRGASILVSSSISEGCPNVIMQALIIGLPIVATNCCGTTEILNNQNCALLVPVGDVDSMSMAMNAMIDKPIFPNKEHFRSEFNQQRNARSHLSLIGLEDLDSSFTSGHSCVE